MKTLVLIQARMGGSRFPGKVKALLAGLTVLEHVSRRAAWMGYDTVISVPPGPETEWDWTMPWRANIGIRMHQPAMVESDVLGRLSATAAHIGHGEQYGAIVRLTADCPFVPVSGIDAVASAVASGMCDYCETRSDPSTRPNGIDAQAFTPALLYEADRTERDRSAREHVTPAVKSRAEYPVTLDCLEGSILDDLPPFRITVDTPADLTVLRAVAKIPVSGAIPPFPTLSELVAVHHMRPDLFREPSTAEVED